MHIARMLPAWPMSGPHARFSEIGSHSRSVASLLAEASRVRPSDKGSAHTATTQLVWPTRGGSEAGTPAIGSHSRTVLSSLAEASRVRPSDNGTAHTART